MESLRRHIFLFDGLGAVLSTSATAYILPALQPWVGLPRWALLVLAAPAAVFAAYSLSCWVLAARPAPWLAIILVGNLSYVAFVAVFLAGFVDVLTPLGWAYFAAEAVVVAAVVAVESWVWRTRSAHAAPHHLADKGAQQPMARLGGVSRMP